MLTKINLLGWCFILLDRKTHKPLANIDKALLKGECKILIYPWNTYPSLDKYFARNISRQDDTTDIPHHSKYLLAQLTFEQRIDIYTENEPEKIADKIKHGSYPWDEIHIYDDVASRELSAAIIRKVEKEKGNKDENRKES